MVSNPDLSGLFTRHAGRCRRRTQGPRSPVNNFSKINVAYIDIVIIFAYSMGDFPMKTRNKKEALSMYSIKNIEMWSGKTACVNVIAFTEGANDARNRGFLRRSCF